MPLLKLRGSARHGGYSRVIFAFGYSWDEVKNMTCSAMVHPSPRLRGRGAGVRGWQGHGAPCPYGFHG